MSPLIMRLRRVDVDVDVDVDVEDDEVVVVVSASTTTTTATSASTSIETTTRSARHVNISDTTEPCNASAFLLLPRLPLMPMPLHEIVTIEDAT